MANTTNRSGPHLACEITSERIIAARATEDGSAVDSFTSRSLAAGTVVPRLGEENIANAEALKLALTDALTTVGARTKDIVAIVPDASVRISLLDFDTLPEKKQDADDVIRFRLKKALPFDVEKAFLSYDVRRRDGKVQVVAAVVLESVLAEYEKLFRELGYMPGVVVPASLAALGNVELGEPVMVIKSEETVTTLAIVANGELHLFRALENSTGLPPTAEQLAEDVHASLIFFEDTFNLHVSRILVGGLTDAEQVGATLQEQAGVPVQNLVATRHLGSSRPNFPASALAGVVGALVG